MGDVSLGNRPSSGRCRVDLRSLRDKSDTTYVKLADRIDAAEHRLDARIEAVSAHVDAKIESSNAWLDGRIDSSGARFDGRIDALSVQVDENFNQLKDSIASARVWALVLYIALAATMLGTMARGFGWV